MYIETSVVSYYVSRRSRDLHIAARQQITGVWWEEVRPGLDCFVAAPVIQEISQGDAAEAIMMGLAY